MLKKHKQTSVWKFYLSMHHTTRPQWSAFKDCACAVFKVHLYISGETQGGCNQKTKNGLRESAGNQQQTGREGNVLSLQRYTI